MNSSKLSKILREEAISARKLRERTNTKNRPNQYRKTDHRIVNDGRWVTVARKGTSTTYVREIPNRNTIQSSNTFSRLDTKDQDVKQPPITSKKRNDISPRAWVNIAKKNSKENYDAQVWNKKTSCNSGGSSKSVTIADYIEPVIESKNKKRTWFEIMEDDSDYE